MKHFIAVAVLVLAGCTTEPSATTDWRPEWQRSWDEVCACWQFTPSQGVPTMIERDDCMTSKDGWRYFATPYSHTGYALALAKPEAWGVQWCDARAIRHEFSHLVSWAKTGNAGENGAGKCWL